MAGATMASVLPRQAPVRPRVISPQTGETLLLENAIKVLVAGGTRRVVHLLGSPGSGKTTALQHLAAVLPAETPVCLIDDAQLSAPAEPDCLIVQAVSSVSVKSGVPVYRLVPWGKDDLIEYLLALHPQQCASVMARLQIPDYSIIGGVPELWRIVLDEMAHDLSLLKASEALKRYLESQSPDPRLMERASYSCLGVLLSATFGYEAAMGSLSTESFTPELARVLRHDAVRLLLAAERVATDLREEAGCEYLEKRLSRALVQAIAAEVAGDRKVLQHLTTLLSGPHRLQPMLASLLHAADAAWVPAPGSLVVLTGAYLQRASWAGVQLPNVSLRDSNLNHADLTAARLDDAEAIRANCCHARLTGASLKRFRASDADLAGVNLESAEAEESCWDGADLRNANLRAAALTRASFRRANLTEAVLTGSNLVHAAFVDAELADADFSGANLNGACLSKLRLWHAIFAGASFWGSNLSGCDMEGMELPGVDCHEANLRGALLTGAVLSDGDFSGACLCETGLGDVNLERACLRNADLRRATFHMGSSRSGLLFTPIASEGTRTGFYTDDANEQNFKAPEEIRKANLRGADLRGARIDEVDFYLVDLREALYDADQERHFRRCRAILEDRAR